MRSACDPHRAAPHLRTSLYLQKWYACTSGLRISSPPVPVSVTCRFMPRMCSDPRDLLGGLPSGGEPMTAAALGDDAVGDATPNATASDSAFAMAALLPLASASRRRCSRSSQHSAAHTVDLPLPGGPLMTHTWGARGELSHVCNGLKSYSWAPPVFSMSACVRAAGLRLQQAAVNAHGEGGGGRWC
jgi:hypothetical protein